MAGWQPERADVISEYAREVLEVHPGGRLVLGIDGIEDPAGAEPSAREAFADDLVLEIAALGVSASGVRMQEFAAEPAATDPERYYDEDAFRAAVLTPYRRGGFAELQAERAVLVVSGPFLHFGALAGIWHTSAWLQIGRAEALERDAARLPGVDLAPWSALVDLAFRRLDARKLANASFDLTDPAHPRRVFEDAC
jgi:uridine kinase